MTGAQIQPAFRLNDQMLTNLFDEKYVRDHLEIRLIPENQISDHTEHHRCFLTLPHCDFSIGFAIRINDSYGVTITEDYLKGTGKSFEDFWKMWLQTEQTEIEITPLDAILASFFSDPTVEKLEPAFQIYVCKYRHSSPGAACILHPDVQEKLLDLIGPFYIIFSSVYESIIISQRDTTAYDLTELLREMNSRPEVVSPEEVASNYIYGVVEPRQLEKSTNKKSSINLWN